MQIIQPPFRAHVTWAVSQKPCFFSGLKRVDCINDVAQTSVFENVVAIGNGVRDIVDINSEPADFAAQVHEEAEEEVHHSAVEQFKSLVEINSRGFEQRSAEENVIRSVLHEGSQVCYFIFWSSCVELLIFYHDPFESEPVEHSVSTVS